MTSTGACPDNRQQSKGDNMTGFEETKFFNIKERDALKHAFCALYKMLIVFDISPSVCFPLPKRYPLSDEQIEKIRYSLDFPCSKEAFVKIVESVERTHKIGFEE